MNKTIEKLLSRSQRKKVKLSQEEKTALFSRVMSQGRPVSLPPQPRKMPWWQIAAPFGLVGTAAAVTFLVMNTHTDQPTQVADQPDAVQEIPVVASTNEDTNDSVPPVVQPTPPPVEETPVAVDGIVDIPFGSGKTSQSTPDRNFISSMIGGFGGGPTEDQQWEIDFTTPVTQEVPAPVTTPFLTMTREQLQDIAALAGFENAQRKDIGGDLLQTTLKKAYADADCINKHIGGPLKQSCFLASTSGFVNAEYTDADAITRAQAKELMSAILGVSVEHIVERPVERSQRDQEFIDWEFTALQVTLPLDLDLPYEYPLWYLGEKNGKVISVTGDAFTIDPNTLKIEVVSEQEAADRLTQNVISPELEGNYTLQLGSQILTEEGLLKGEINFEITSVELVYKRFWSNDGPRMLQPVYQFTGVERTNDHPVIFIVDATKTGKLAENHALQQ